MLQRRQMTRRENLFNILAGVALLTAFIAYLIHLAIPHRSIRVFQATWVTCLVLGIAFEGASRWFGRRERTLRDSR